MPGRQWVPVADPGNPGQAGRTDSDTLERREAYEAGGGTMEGSRHFLRLGWREQVKGRLANHWKRWDAKPEAEVSGRLARSFRYDARSVALANHRKR